MKIFLYGVPGVGKSTLAKQLAQHLGYDYIELDTVRPNAQHLVTQEEAPFVYEYTTEAWRHFGELSSKTAVQGFLAVRHALTPFITSELEKHPDNFVAEAVYLDPNAFMPQGASCFLITSPDQNQHFSQFFVRRPRTEDEENNQFKAARWMQDHLISEAKKLGLDIIDNQELDETIKKLNSRLSN